MSGGSFNYLCYADNQDIFDKKSDLDDMAHALQGVAPDAAKETEDLIVYIQHVERQLEARINSLSDIWKAKEWRDSFDTSEESFQRSLAEYRAK